MSAVGSRFLFCFAPLFLGPGEIPVKTCFRYLFAILCVQMLIFYIGVCLILGGTQSCLCCLYNLRCWYKKNPHFYLSFYVDGHFNMSQTQVKLYQLYLLQMYLQTGIVLTIYFWNGFIILITGSSNTWKWAMIRRKQAQEWCPKQHQPSGTICTVFRGWQVVARAGKETPLSSKR